MPGAPKLDRLVSRFPGLRAPATSPPPATKETASFPHAPDHLRLLELLLCSDLAIRSGTADPTQPRPLQLPAPHPSLHTKCGERLTLPITNELLRPLIESCDPETNPAPFVRQLWRKNASGKGPRPDQSKDTPSPLSKQFARTPPQTPDHPQSYPPRPAPHHSRRHVRTTARPARRASPTRHRNLHRPSGISTTACPRQARKPRTHQTPFVKKNPHETRTHRPPHTSRITRRPTTTRPHQPHDRPSPSAKTSGHTPTPSHRRKACQQPRRCAWPRSPTSSPCRKWTPCPPSAPPLQHRAGHPA